jgi:MFS family permease
MFGLTRYQSLVLFAAWLGWGFDVFDGLLFNYVAPICVPQLLHVAPRGPEAFRYTGYLTALLLIGWAIGGILFGKITDRIGRTRTLLFTMLTYALCTAACAFAWNLPSLALLRFGASLGIGGEWAAGAALVAEAMPKDKRVQGGALLYTSAPAGLFLATFVNDLFTRKFTSIASDPTISWRAVFLMGLVPAAVALVIRMKVHEPDAWQPGAKPRIRELFEPVYLKRTLGGLAMALVALLTWWSCSSFIPGVASYLAQLNGAKDLAFTELRAAYITRATTAFNIGGLLGTLLTIPVALNLGRRPMFLGYFALGALSILGTFGLPMPAEWRLLAMFPVGLTVFGVFGAFTFYLPELFPVRLRGTGSGFCYNAGRILTSVGPFLIGMASRKGTNPLEILRWVAIVPALGVLLILLGVGEETRGRDLAGEG